jgi:hypothetical protein
MPYNVKTFTGVWERSEYYQPKGVLNDCQTTVIWMQTSSGVFIDVRTPKIPGGLPSDIKSFAGQFSFDSSSSVASWQRQIDYCLPGTPDSGHMEKISDDSWVESSVLPGENYSETWTRWPQALSASLIKDCAVKLVYSNDRLHYGYFVCVGGYWGLALGRPEDSEGTAALLKGHFDGKDISASDWVWVQTVLNQYIGMIGKINGSADCPVWTVLHSTRSSLQGQSVDMSNPLFCFLSKWRLDVLAEGELPHSWFDAES